MLQQVTRDEFDSLLKQKTLVIAEFTSPHCNSCKSYKKILESKLIPFTEKRDDVAVIHVDIEHEKELGNMLNIRSVPTTMFFVKGKKMTFNDGQDRFLGVVNDITHKTEKILTHLASL